MKGRITIIIVSCNGLEDLRECLPTVMALDDSDYDVLLVDNGSNDGSVEFVEKNFPLVIIEKMGSNLGFARGNNRGMSLAFARGAVAVALLNNDTKITSQWLSGFRSVFSLHPLVGIVGGAILNWEGDIVEFDGTVFHPNNASGGYVDRPVSENPIPSQPREIAYACGGALAMTRECHDKIGGFDESFFCYNEDVDLSLRAWILGFRVMLSPQSITNHRRGASTRRLHKAHFGDYYGMRNALTTALKNYEPSTIRCIYRDLITIHLLSDQSHRRKGALMNLLFLPRTLWKRHWVQVRRLRSDNDIFVRTSGGEGASGS